jgi:hypothetical protein
VTLPTNGNCHSQEIVEWVENHCFGKVDLGAVFTGISQDYWFDNPDDALATLLAWS